MRPLRPCSGLIFSLTRPYSTPAALLALDNDISASIASHLATLFARSLQNHPQLSILPGRRAWQIILDLTVFAADGGNLLDASAAAARSALNNLRIPRTKPIGLSKEGGKASKSGIASLLKPGATSRVKGKQRATDFELESYYDEGVPLKGAEDLPVSVTLNLVRSSRCSDWCEEVIVSVQLGDIVFIDADLQEERCAPSRLILGVDRKSRIRLVRQEGEMEVGIARLDGLIDQAAPMAAELIESLNAFQNPPGRA